MQEKTKKIVITITLIIVLIIGGVTIYVGYAMKQKKLAEQAKVPDEYINEKLPKHYVYYLEKENVDLGELNIYNEKGEKQEDFEVYLSCIETQKMKRTNKVKQKAPHINFESMVKIGSRAYVFQGKNLLMLSPNSANRTVDLSEKNIVAMVPVRDSNEIMYVNSSGSLNIYSLEDSKEKKELNNFSYDELKDERIKNTDIKYRTIRKMYADKDGLYAIISSPIDNEELYRYAIKNAYGYSTYQGYSCDQEVKDFIKVEDWIYYISLNDKCLYRVYKDGTQKAKIADDIIEYKDVCYNDKYNANGYICGEGDTVYYIDNKNELKRKGIKSLEEEVCLTDVENITYAYGYIYYTKLSEDGLFIYDIANRETEKVVDFKIKNYIVCNSRLPE